MTNRTAATRLTPEQLLDGAARLVGCPPGASPAKRFLDAAPASGIDPSLIWGATDRQGRIREVCLVVLGAGRTAMMFLSGPNPAGGDADRSVDERAACIRAAATYLDAETETSLMQALPSPDERSAISAFRAGGLTELAELSYLRRAFRDNDPSLAVDLGPDLEAVNVETLGGLESARNELMDVLDATYEDTRDCPGLCGMRATSDVLESHKAVGRFDPSRWWVLRRGGRGVGCLLLNQCPELDAIELVYVGLAVSARGSGLAHKLLCLGIAGTHRVGAHEMTCAVDRANKPALDLYERLGFVSFASREAMVGVPGDVAHG